MSSVMVFSEKMVREGVILIKCDISDSMRRSVRDVRMAVNSTR